MLITMTIHFRPRIYNVTLYITLYLIVIYLTLWAKGAISHWDSPIYFWHNFKICIYHPQTRCWLEKSMDLFLHEFPLQCLQQLQLKKWKYINASLCSQTCFLKAAWKIKFDASKYNILLLYNLAFKSAPKRENIQVQKCSLI